MVRTPGARPVSCDVHWNARRVRGLAKEVLLSSKFGGSRSWKRCVRLGCLSLSLLLAGFMVPAAPAQQPARTIEIHAKKYVFVPAEITLTKGEPIELVLISDDVPHGLAVSGLHLHAEMTKDHPAKVLVTPTVDGTFPGKCSRFCGLGHNDMKFTVHVVDKVDK